MTYIFCLRPGEARGGWSGGGERQVNDAPVQVQVELSRRLKITWLFPEPSRAFDLADFFATLLHPSGLRPVASQFQNGK